LVAESRLAGAVFCARAVAVIYALLTVLGGDCGEE
jgi:hypothetical protein